MLGIEKSTVNFGLVICRLGHFVRGKRNHNYNLVTMRAVRVLSLLIIYTISYVVLGDEETVYPRIVAGAYWKEFPDFIVYEASIPH